MEENLEEEVLQMVKRVSSGPPEAENYAEMTYDELRDLNTIINFSITEHFNVYLASRQPAGKKKKNEVDMAKQANIIGDFLEDFQAT